MTPVGTAKTFVTGIGPRKNPTGFQAKPLNLLLVRDDGYLCMGNDDILQLNSRLRIYHGKVDDPPDVVEAFLRGQERMSRYAAPMIAEGQLDITRMSTAELVKYAFEEYGIRLDPNIEYAHALVAVISERNKLEGSGETKEKVKPAATGISA
jgi:hypothetical protein